MAISYDDFIVQIPYETKMIIDKYLKYLYYYIDNEFSTGLDFYDESSDICEEITLLLYILSEDDKYSVFTKNIGLKKEDLSIEDYDLLGREIANNYSFDFKETFKKYSNLFQFFEEDYYYPKLTPLHVLNNLLTNY